MFKLIIETAVRHRWLVVFMAALIAAVGLFQLGKLPIDAVPDITNRQVQIAGVKVPKDAQVLVMLASGNRDESQFPEGESFDIDRQNASRHLSFGHGIHYCLGAPLARLELRVFLEELTRNVSDMRLVEGQDYRYLPNTTHRGPTSLRVYRDSDRAS